MLPEGKIAWLELKAKGVLAVDRTARVSRCLPGGSVITGRWRRAIDDVAELSKRDWRHKSSPSRANPSSRRRKQVERRLKIITADERMAQDKVSRRWSWGQPVSARPRHWANASIPSRRCLSILRPAISPFATSTSIRSSPGPGKNTAGPVRLPRRDPTRHCRRRPGYSQAHYDEVVASMGGADALKKYATYFVDSFTVAGRLCFRWCEPQPDSVNDRGKKHLLGTYGLMGREMIAWLTHFCSMPAARTCSLSAFSKTCATSLMSPSWEL